MFQIYKVMFEVVGDVYQSPKLLGEFLCRPWKSYTSYFSAKIDAAEDMEEAAWKVAAFAVGIFALPVFGSTALVGMLFKSLQFLLLSHNEKQIVIISVQCASVPKIVEEGLVRDTRPAAHEKLVFAHIIEKDLNAYAEAESDACEHIRLQVEKVYSHTVIDPGLDSPITIQLFTLDEGRCAQ